MCHSIIFRQRLNKRGRAYRFDSQSRRSQGGGGVKTTLDFPFVLQSQWRCLGWPCGVHYFNIAGGDANCRLKTLKLGKYLHFVASNGGSINIYRREGRGDRTRDRKVAGSSPGRNNRRIFFSSINFLCWLLLRYMFHPHVITVAHKRSRSFCQKCKWQVTAKHTCTLRMSFQIKWYCKLMRGCIVFTQPAPRRQQLHAVPAVNNQTALLVHHFGVLNQQNKNI